MSETVLKKDMLKVKPVCVCVCVTCLTNKSAGDYELCCFVTLLAFQKKSKSFAITWLCLCSRQGNCMTLWEMGGGRRSCGNLCYVTGLLSGKGEQWLTAPLWKALGWREKLC